MATVFDLLFIFQVVSAVCLIVLLTILLKMSRGLSLSEPKNKYPCMTLAEKNIIT